MGIAPTPFRQCYLAEWFGPALSAGQLDAMSARMRGAASAVELLMMLTIPADEVALALFTAESEQAVEQMCRRIGAPVRRVTAAFGVVRPQAMSREFPDSSAPRPP